MVHVRFDGSHSAFPDQPHSQPMSRAQKNTLSQALNALSAASDDPDFQENIRQVNLQLSSVTDWSQAAALLYNHIPENQREEVQQQLQSRGIQLAPPVALTSAVFLSAPSENSSLSQLISFCQTLINNPSWVVAAESGAEPNTAAQFYLDNANRTFVFLKNAMADAESNPQWGASDFFQDFILQAYNEKIATADNGPGSGHNLNAYIPTPTIVAAVAALCHWSPDTNFKIDMGGSEVEYHSLNDFFEMAPSAIPFYQNLFSVSPFPPASPSYMAWASKITETVANSVIALGLLAHGKETPGYTIDLGSLDPFLLTPDLNEPELSALLSSYLPVQATPFDEAYQEAYNFQKNLPAPTDWKLAANLWTEVQQLAQGGSSPSAASLQAWAQEMTDGDESYVTASATAKAQFCAITGAVDSTLSNQSKIAAWVQTLPPSLATLGQGVLNFANSASTPAELQTDLSEFFSVNGGWDIFMSYPNLLQFDEQGNLAKNYLATFPIGCVQPEPSSLVPTGPDLLYCRVNAAFSLPFFSADHAMMLSLLQKIQGLSSQPNFAAQLKTWGQWVITNNKVVYTDPVTFQPVTAPFSSFSSGAQAAFHLYTGV